MLNPKHIIKMEKWIKGILTVVALLIVAFLGYSLTSCKDMGDNRAARLKADSSVVAKAIEDYNHPQLKNVDDAIILQNQMLMDHDYEQVFMNMTQSTLKAVIHVITNQAHSQTFTIKDVAQEYLSNRRIYDNLPKGNDASKPKQGSPEELELDSVGGL